MKFKLFGLTIEVKRKVSLEKRLIKEYGARAYKMALIYCKNLTEEGLREACELAKTNITILADAMQVGEVLPRRTLLDMLRAEIYNANGKIEKLKDAEQRATWAEFKVTGLKKSLQRKNENIKKLIKSKYAAINNLNAQVHNDKTYKEGQDKLIEKLLVKIAEYEEAINKLSHETTEPTV